MADFLVIKLPASGDAAARWIVADSNGTVKTQVTTGTLAEAHGAVPDLPVIALAPGGDVATMNVDLPIKSGSKLRAAVPYALEDQLATDIDELHFAMGAHRESGLLPVAVVDRHAMDGWLEQLQDAGVQPYRIVADYHGVQRVPNTVTMFATSSAVMLNDGADLEFAIEGVQPSDALGFAGLLEDTQAAETSAAESESETADGDDEPASAAARHLVAWCDAAAAEKYQHDFNALRSELASVDVHLMDDDGFARLAATIAAGAGVNLLQGSYGKKTEIAGILKPWRIAAGLLVGALLIGLAGKGVDYVQLTRQQAALEQQYSALYQQLTGDSRTPADPIGTADSLMRQLSGNSGNTRQVFLPSLMELASAVSQNREATVEAISYRAGVIDIRLTAPDVATLDKIQQLVGNSGRFSASIQATNQDEDGKVNSRIQIRETGA